MLSDLTLSHFRSHRRTVLAFDGRPVAIYGPNGAGKTNILEAVSLLSPGRGLRRAGTDELARKPEALGWKISASLDGHEIETFAEGNAARTAQIDGKVTTQAALGRIARVLWLVPAMDRLWIEGADGRRWLPGSATTEDAARAALLLACRSEWVQCAAGVQAGDVSPARRDAAAPPLFAPAHMRCLALARRAPGATPGPASAPSLH